MRALFALLPPLLAGPALGQEVRDRLPVEPDARLTEAVRASLARLTADVDGWDTEIFASAAGGQLKHLVEEVVLQGGPLPEGLAGPETGCELLRPARLEELAGEGCFRVLRAPPDLSAEERALAHGSQALAGRLAELGALLEGCAQRRAKVKVTGVRADPDGRRVETDVRVELYGLGERGAVQVTAYWTCTWSSTGLSAGSSTGSSSGSDDPPDAAPLLRLVVNAHEEVRRAAGPLFADVTEAVLGGEVFDAQLRPGLTHWRERLDASLGVGFLGHCGAALGDVDGDGLEDLYLCQPGGLPNRLFLHRDDGRAVEGAAQRGVDFLPYSTSALLVDLDGDRDPDLMVVVGDELLVLENERGRFQGRARLEALGITSLSAVDVDGDGDLDVYACGYVSPYDRQGTPLPYHDANNGGANVMHVNEGGWRFVDRTAELGLDQNNRRFSLAAAWEDFDDDGDQDLYVANDFGRNNLYRNDGGRFVDVAAELGVEDISAGMGVSWADVDGDGRMDLHVANMFSSAGNRIAFQRRFQGGEDALVRGWFQRHVRGDSLFLNRGQAGFVDASVEAGISMGRWAWGAVFLELDNDGRPDLYVPNGFVTGERSDDL